MTDWWRQYNPENVNLTADVPGSAWAVCVIEGVYFGENEYNGHFGGRVSSVFVIFICALLTTCFPIIAKQVRKPWLRIPEVVYMIAKMFGSGVIVTTAFIHLMDPAYSEIGPQSCVGMTGQWSIYSWCPAIMLASAVGTFIVDAYADFYADVKYGTHGHSHGGDDLAFQKSPAIGDAEAGGIAHVHSHGSSASGMDLQKKEADAASAVSAKPSMSEEADFYSQIYGFFCLEFGVIFHSVMIGLTLGTSDEYSTLYVVLVFHQSFEGLGIGARLSAIPFAPHRWWWPYVLAFAYSVSTPITIGIGIGVRTTYRDSSYTALVVSGVLDAMSAGVMMYTGFVELLARDFIFNPLRTKNGWYLSLQLFVFLWGAGLMALLGKWA